MSRAYEVVRRAWQHRVAPWSDAQVAVITAVVVLAAWGQRFVLAIALAVAVGSCWRRPSLLVACLVLGGAAATIAARAWDGARPRHVGQYSGWVTLAADPEPRGAGVHVVLLIEGERFDSWIYGSRRHRVESHLAGERVWIEGTRRPLASGQRRHLQVRHVVGRVDVDTVADAAPGTPLARTANTVRRNLRRAAESAMSDDDAALFAGLVVGDDVRESDATVGAFRASGLSHLTAVSGQNVAFVIAACSPLLTRLRPMARWLATVAVVVWFAALTRFEPSVLRASVMAVTSSWAFVTGRDRPPRRVLCFAVVVLVLVDPLLVWSVAFWLSVGATAGVVVVGPWVGGRLPGPRWVVAPLAVTLGAQVGIALPSWLVFGRLPLVSVPANLLAGPAAGFVMLYGLPAALVGALLPASAAAVVLAPATVCTRWVAVVARLGERMEPPSPWGSIGWLVLGATVSVGCWSAGRRRGGGAGPDPVPS
jgi:competence protein ComEC